MQVLWPRKLGHRGDTKETLKENKKKIGCKEVGIKGEGCLKG